MAIQNKTLSSAEHDFYLTSVAGLPGNTSLNQAKRRYFANNGVTGTGKTTPQMEVEFLKLRIAQVGSTTADSNRLADLWLQMASVDGYSIVNKTWTQAKFEWLVGSH